MRSKFVNMKLGEIISCLTDYHANGGYKTLKENVTLLDSPDYAVMIRTKNFEQNDFKDDLKYINEHAYNFLSKSKVFTNDILMNKIANAGSVYCMPKLDQPVSLAMNLFLIRINKDLAEQKYIYYYLKCNEKYVKSFANGAATNTITKQSVKNLEVLLPSRLIQRKIIKIIYNYEQLIQNNTKRIEILEEIAQRIYKEWFVKFKYPGYEDGELENSQLGVLPEGWENRNLNEYVSFDRGIEPGSKHYLESNINNTIPFLRVGDLGSINKKIYIPINLANGKILFKKDIVITLDGTVGIVKTGLEGCYSTGLRKCNIINNSINRPFLFYTLKSRNIQSTIKAHAIGSTILHASSSIKHMKFIIPTSEIMDRFYKIVNPIFNEIQILSDKNNNLSVARDYLLPKLISGKVDISDLDIDTGILDD